MHHLTNDRNTGKGRWRKRLALAIAALLLLAGLTLSPSQQPPPNGPPTTANAEAAKDLFYKVRWASKQDGPRILRFSWDDLAGTAKFGGRLAGIDNARITREGSTIRVSGSKLVMFGLWANAALFITPQGKGPPVYSAQIGHLPLPGFVVEGLIWCARKLLALRGIDVPPPAELLRALKVDAAGIAATVVIPEGIEALQAVNLSRMARIDPHAVARHYCRIADAVQGNAARPLPDLIAAAIPETATSTDDDRAALVALAMIAVAPEAGRIAGDAALTARTCDDAQGEPLLLDRADLAKHWSLSAALAAAYGPNMSATVGLWKEVADSGADGSGFSYVDLAADRSGVLAATQLSNSSEAAATRIWLRQAGERDLLPIRKLALLEGMSEADYARRYTNVDSTRHADVVKRIDAALKASMKP